MPNSLLEISKVSFREEFSSQIYNSYDVRSKQNGLLVIYRIYVKSFMIFSDLYMCCFGITKLLGTQTSSKFSATCCAYVVRLHACTDTWPSNVAPHICLAGSAQTRQFRPFKGKTEPLLYRSLSLYFLVPFSSMHVSPLWCLAVGHKRCQPDGPWPAKGEFLFLLNMIPFLSLRFQFNQLFFASFPQLQ
jgi:hypothetical protein